MYHFHVDGFHNITTQHVSCHGRQSQSTVFCLSATEVAEKEVEEVVPLTGVDDEEQRIADMGRPTLGDHVKLEIIIEESYEFKVCARVFTHIPFPFSHVMHSSETPQIDIHAYVVIME